MLSSARPWIAGLSAVLLCSPVRAETAPSICDGVAAYMRTGVADGTGTGAPFGQFLAMAEHSGGQIRIDGSGGADLATVIESSRATPALRAAAQRLANVSEEIEPRVYWFGQSGLGMIFGAGALPDCRPELSFFMVSADRAEPVASPDVAITGDACSTLAVWASTINGLPFLVVQDDSIGASQEGLTLVPWTGAGWGKPCAIVATYKVHFHSVGGTCRAGVDCARMKALTHMVYDRFNADVSSGMEPDADGAAVDLDGGLISLANHTAALSTLPAFSKNEGRSLAGDAGENAAHGVKNPTVVRELTGLPLTEHGYSGTNPRKWDAQDEVLMEVTPDTAFLHRMLYPIAFEDISGRPQRGVAVIGRGRSIATREGGMLIALWEISGNALVPVAGFQTVAIRGKLASADAGPSYVVQMPVQPADGKSAGVK